MINKENKPEPSPQAQQDFPGVFTAVITSSAESLPELNWSVDTIQLQELELLDLQSAAAQTLLPQRDTLSILPFLKHKLFK